MDSSTFARIAAILPLVQDEGFHFSCRFEPLINPNLLELLDLIPKSQKNKAFLTTNISRPLSEEFIQKLLRSNLHHINISIETLDPAMYHSLCPGGRFETFFDNLTRLVSALQEIERPPKIRFITMILRDNYHELIDIAVRCHDEFHSDLHEFRTPYPYSLYSIDPDWAEHQLLTRAELDDLDTRLKGLPFRTCCSLESDITSLKTLRDHPGNSCNSDDHDIYAMRDHPVPAEELPKMGRNDDFYDVRIESDGSVYFYGTRERFDIKSIPDPSLFFAEKLNQLVAIQISGYPPVRDATIPCLLTGECQIAIDEFSDGKTHLGLSGWSFLNHMDCNEYEKILIVRNGTKTIFYPVESKSRPDVAGYFNDERYLNSGFICFIDKKDLEERIIRVGILHRPRSALPSFQSALYGEYPEELAF